MGENKFDVKFDEPLRDITPGQGAVVYVEDEIIGGGIIEGEGNKGEKFIPIKLINENTTR